MIYHVLAAIATLHWVMVSDIHLNPFSTTGYVRGTDTSPELWRMTIREMHAVDGDAPVVFVGGDLLAHHFAELARRAGQNPEYAGIATIAGIAKDLRQTFPRAQFLVALGNNDDPCGDYRSDVAGTYLAKLVRIFSPLVDVSGAAPNFGSSFMRGGYYTVRLPRGERGIVLNSVLWSIAYRGGCYGQASNPAAQEMRWLAHVLGRGENVVLMHIPMGYDPYSTTVVHRLVAVPFLTPAYNAGLLSLFAEDRAHIAFALAGHVHRYGFRIPGGVPMLVASSVSPIYNNNPAFYELDVSDNGDLHDVVPFIYEPFSGTWERKTSFDSMYGVDGFTEVNLRRTADLIEKDPAVRARWIAAYDVWSWRMGDVLDHPWRVFWCAQTEFGSGYARCAATQHRTEALLAALAAAVTGVIVAGILTVLRRRRARPDVRGR
jgi:hypothetical protein